MRREFYGRDLFTMKKFAKVEYVKTDSNPIQPIVRSKYITFYHEADALTLFTSNVLHIYDYNLKIKKTKVYYYGVMLNLIQRLVSGLGRFRMMFGVTS